MKTIRNITILTLAALTLFLPSKLTAQSSANELERAKKTIDRIKMRLLRTAGRRCSMSRLFVDGDGFLVVGGKISERKNAEILADALADARIDYESRVKILPDTLWALVSIPVASLRTAPRHSAEMATQAVMGTPVRILEKTDNWNRVQCPDGYIAYVPASSLSTKSAKTNGLMAQKPTFYCQHTLAASGIRQRIIIRTSRCCIGTYNRLNHWEAEGGAASISNGRLHISLPDGRTAYAEAKAFTPLEEWAAQSFNPNVYSTSPTLWKVSHIFGAEHRQKATDCSGLVKTAYFANGIILICATHRSRQIQADASKPRTQAVPRRRSGFLRKQIDRKK